MRVLVTNIPVRAFACAWVDVPDDTTADTANEAVRKGLETAPLRIGDVAADGIEPDPVLIDGWDFDVEQFR